MPCGFKQATGNVVTPQSDQPGKRRGGNPVGCRPLLTVSGFPGNPSDLDGPAYFQATPAPLGNNQADVQAVGNPL